eukprot:13278859-Alexandrium_andersonii.AAC.1
MTRRSSKSQGRRVQTPTVITCRSSSPPPGRPTTSPSQGTCTPLHTRRELARARIVTLARCIAGQCRTRSR